MQKTIHLSDNYRIHNDQVQVFCYDQTIWPDPEFDDPDYDRKSREIDFARHVWRDSKYAVGAMAILVSKTDVSPNAIRTGTDEPMFFLVFDLEGIPGNSDYHIKRTTGWRGTTNDVSLDAYGVVRITKIRQLRNGKIAVTVVTQ